VSRLSVVEPLLRHPRYEVIPSDAIEDAVVSSVPQDVTLTVTASPTKGLEATIALAQRLSEHGFTVVPPLGSPGRR
jgi:methylenetetrahydrofolate reductase (NADPH)